jgi:transcriptional regulator with XRE-family HTH domain
VPLTVGMDLGEKLFRGQYMFHVIHILETSSAGNCTLPIGNPITILVISNAMEIERMKANLHANITRLMMERGWSMAELSKRANAGSTGVFDIINGRSRSPKLETVAKIAMALNVSVVDLLSDEPRSKYHAEILDVFDHMSSADRDRLLAVARAFVSPAANAS